jgi:hypothetical protein
MGGTEIADLKYNESLSYMPTGVMGIKSLTRELAANCLGVIV